MASRAGIGMGLSGATGIRFSNLYSFGMYQKKNLSIILNLLIEEFFLSLSNIGSGRCYKLLK